MNRELLSYGTRVITLDDGEESDNPANLLLTMLNMTLLEIDNRIRSRNIKSGILRALKEGDRDQQVHKLRIEIERHKQNLLKLDQQRFLIGEMDPDSYKRLKLHTTEQIDRLTIQPIKKLRAASMPSLK